MTSNNKPAFLALHSMLHYGIFSTDTISVLYPQRLQSKYKKDIVLEIIGRQICDIDYIWDYRQPLSSQRGPLEDLLIQGCLLRINFSEHPILPLHLVFLPFSLPFFTHDLCST